MIQVFCSIAVCVQYCVYARSVSYKLQDMWISAKCKHITYYLVTESEVFMGKFQIDTYTYQYRKAEVWDLPVKTER